nr:GAP family protein [Herbiconiux sp. VKM Ac-2851]
MRVAPASPRSLTCCPPLRWIVWPDPRQGRGAGTRGRPPARCRAGGNAAGQAGGCTWALGSGLSAIAPRPVFGHRTVVGAAELVVGLALIVYGILALRRTGRASEAPRRGWLDRLASVHLWTAIGVGVVLNLRPKALLLAVAGGLAIGSSRLTTAETIAAAAIYAALSASVIGGIVVAHLVRTRPGEIDGIAGEGM